MLFSARKSQFLGHIVSQDGIEADPDTIEKIRNWPRLSNPDELRSFVALAGYYRRFVKDFSKVAKPHRSSPININKQECQV